METMDWMAELRRLGGAASVRQLRAAGATERALRNAVAAGRLVRPRAGRYVLPDAAEPLVSAVRAGAKLSCVTAARSYGLWGGNDVRTHLRMPLHAGRPGSADATQVRHWSRSECQEEIWRVSLADCLRSVVRCSDQETAVAVLDTAISSSRITPSGIRRIFQREPRRSRNVAELARPGSDSGVESLLRQRLIARDHFVEQQIAVPGVGRVDARVDGVLYVEVDGYEFHRGRAAFERDRQRDTGLALLGARWMRFSASEVLQSPEKVVATIERVLRVVETEAISGSRTG